MKLTRKAQEICEQYALRADTPEQKRRMERVLKNLGVAIEVLTARGRCTARSRNNLLSFDWPLKRRP